MIRVMPAYAYFALAFCGGVGAATPGYSRHYCQTTRQEANGPTKS